jgi:hypothetical protein
MAMRQPVFLRHPTNKRKRNRLMEINEVAQYINVEGIVIHKKKLVNKMTIAKRNAVSVAVRTKRNA